MDMLGSIARIDSGGPVGRRSGGGAAVPAPSPTTGGSSDDSNQRGGTPVAKQPSSPTTVQVKAAPPQREVAQQQPAVQLGGFYEKRITNGPNGLTIDLVYKNTGLRAARLVGRTGAAPSGATSEGDGEQAVAAGTAVRAYQTARGGALATTTQLTG
jgi:hypothetical protein